MSPKGRVLVALAVTALAIPAIASAQQGYDAPPAPQSYGAPPYGQSGPDFGQADAGQRGYEQPQSDYDQGGPPIGAYGYDQGPGSGGPRARGGEGQGQQGKLGVYPQFRSLEKHIKRTVREKRRSNALAPRDAHQLMAQLRQIQSEEMSAYQSHGMDLPPRLQARIQGELTQLAQAVDQGQASGRDEQAYQERQ